MKLSKLVLASNNLGKAKEIQKITAAHGWEIVSQANFNTPEIEETGLSFIENAILKARNAAKHSGMPALADDSGLEVVALKGAPGVYSARYAGDQKSDTANVAKLLHELAGSAIRQARFVTVLTLHHAGKYYVFEGEIQGQINDEPTGSNGFGYDPVFVPEGMDQTFAELSLVEKNQIAHRARALQKFKKFVNDSRIFQLD